MSARSIRLRFVNRCGHQLDLTVEKIPEGDGSLHINSEPGGDDGVQVTWSIKPRREAGRAEGDVDHPIQYSATTEQVGIDDRNVVGVGDQTPIRINDLLSHFNASISQLGLPQNFANPTNVTAKKAGVES